MKMTFLITTAAFFFVNSAIAQSSRYLTPGIFNKSDHQTLRAICVDGSVAGAPCDRLIFELNGRTVGPTLSRDQILQKFDPNVLSAAQQEATGKSDEYSKGFPYAVRLLRYKLYHTDNRAPFWHMPLRKMGNEDRLKYFFEYDGNSHNPIDHSRFEFSAGKFVLKRIEVGTTKGKYYFVYVMKDHETDFDAYVKKHSRAAKYNKENINSALDALINQTLTGKKAVRVNRAVFEKLQAIIENN